MAHSTADNAYVIDLEGGYTCTFVLKPSSLSDSKQANFAQYDILGRSSPLFGYQTGPPRTIEFTLIMFAEHIADGNKKTIDQVEQDKNFLLSLPYPDYRGGIKPPHRCLISIGQSFKMVGVCAAASADAPENYPWEVGPGLIHGVQMRMSFIEVPKNGIPLDTYDRRAGGY